MARSFEEIYQIAPEPAVRRLLAFREKYPFRIIEKEGMIYHVWDTGNGYGERAMVFLPSTFLTGLFGVNLGGIPGNEWHLGFSDGFGQGYSLHRVFTAGMQAYAGFHPADSCGSGRHGR